VNLNDPTVISKIEGWLENFTFPEGFEVRYRPSFNLETETGGIVRMNDGHIEVNTPVWPDSRSPGKRSRGHFIFPMDWYLFDRPNGEEHFKRYIRTHVMHHIATHEMDEWLLYNGVREWDPHASQKPRKN
jgi:hypothetical protein